MSWHFLKTKDFGNSPCSPEQEEASWAGSCLDGAPSALLSLIPTASESCLPDSGTDSCPDSQSGTMCRPLTASLGADTLMSSVGDFLAPTFQAPVEERELRESNPACGNTWRELSVKFDLATSSWKTAQCLFDEDLPESSLTLPRWGMMRDGVLSERTTLPLRINATESGFWPTIRASDGERGGRGDLIQAIRGNPNKHYKLWPTPTVCGNYNRKGASKTSGDGLATVAGGSLNPNWTEWLMGWPVGWTDLKPLATDKFQQWLRSHGVCLEGQ